MGDEVYPAIVPKTTVLPPDHSSTKNAKKGDLCPLANAAIPISLDPWQLVTYLIYIETKNQRGRPDPAYTHPYICARQ